MPITFVAMKPSTLLRVAALMSGLGSLAMTPCKDCVDRWEGTVDAQKHIRHTTFVEAGRDYRVAVVPHDANADLVVSADGEWPPTPIACKAAAGGTSPDVCVFGSKASGPVHVFVLGREKATRYDLGIEVAAD